MTLSLNARCRTCHLHIATALLMLLSGNVVRGQQTTGASAGWVVADRFEAQNDIDGNEIGVNLVTGPGVFMNPTPITASSPDGSAWAETEFPDVRVLIDSTNLSTTQVAYGGAYYGDTLTFTGGTGSFELRMTSQVEGSISGAGGAYSIGGAPPTGGATVGQSAVNQRMFFEPFSFGLPDFDDPNLYKGFAVGVRTDLTVPDFRPTFPDDYPPWIGSGNFFFEEAPNGQPSGVFRDSVLTDQNASELAIIGTSPFFTWDYDVPLKIGLLLEGWASSGGIVDFSGTGSIAEIRVPLGTTVSSEAGGSYTVTFTAPDGDFNDDGSFDCLDIDALVDDIAADSNTAEFDLTGDGVTDALDLADWLVEAGANNPNQTGGNPFLSGDGNLDGVVDASDFNIWNSNKFTTTAAWCSGDFNADGSIDASDFNAWNNNKFTTSNDFAAVPEPGSVLSVALATIACIAFRRQRCHRKTILSLARCG